jgi:hypothetical protein
MISVVHRNPQHRRQYSASPLRLSPLGHGRLDRLAVVALSEDSSHTACIDRRDDLRELFDQS